jgi:hypothetical protein
MARFVTHIVPSYRAAATQRVRGASAGDDASDTDVYRRRLAGLRTPAPDTLRARVRRELRAAAAATTVRSE